MYICQRCGKVSQSGQTSSLITVEFQRWKFPFREKVHMLRREGKTEYRDDPGGEGLQIVKEIRVCSLCEKAIKEGDVGQW